MQHENLPIGKPINTPWKIVPTGEWRTLGKVTSELLHVLPDKDVVGSKHYKTCAVVGSAGILLTQADWLSFSTMCIAALHFTPRRETAPRNHPQNRSLVHTGHDTSKVDQSI
eukprot:scaffold93465_cov53-Prasinocladus_malaysianus.AAC.2